jgi:hypothetical protein
MGENLRTYKLSDNISVELPSGTEIVTLGARSGSKAGWWHYADVLAAGKPFRTSGSLCGGPVSYRQDIGRLDTSWRESLHSADYVVWSYWTPIAWRTPDGWVIPAAGTFGSGVESSTTVAQINKIRTAVGSFTEYRERVDG